MTTNWKTILLQQIPFAKVQRLADYSLHFQSSLARSIKDVYDKLSGEYLESFLREYFRMASEFDDLLMEYYLTARKLPSHHRLYFEWSNNSVPILSTCCLVERGSTAQYVWEAGVALAEYLIRNSHLVEGKRVLELGCGTGICGLIADQLPTKGVCLSDLAFVYSNVTMKNMSPSIDFVEFDWRYPETLDFGMFDLVIASDVIFDPDLVSCLVDVVLKAKRADAAVLICQKIRNPDTFSLFCDLLASHSCTFSVVDAAEPQLFFYEQIDMKLINL